MVSGKLSDHSQPIVALGTEPSVRVRWENSVGEIRTLLNGEKPPNIAVVLEDGRPKAVVHDYELEGVKDETPLLQFVQNDRKPCPDPIVVRPNDSLGVVLSRYLDAVNKWREQYKDPKPIAPDIIVTGSDHNIRVVPAKQFTDFTESVIRGITKVSL